MRRALIFAAAIVAAVSAQASKWSLDSCVTYAIEHNIDVAASRISQMEGELDVTSAKDAFLPQLSGYASQNFNFGRGLTADNTYANRNTHAFSVGANLNLPIFQGLKGVRRLSYSRTALRALVEQTEATKDDVTLNVLGQYLQALYAREMLQVAEANLDISTAELSRRRQLLEAGKIPELDIYEAISQVSQDELAVVNARNDSVIAMLDLAQLLNLPDATGFDIEPLDTRSAMPLLSADDVWANAGEHNHSLRAGRLQKEAADKNVSLAKASYIPTLSFNAGIGTNYYRTSGIINENFGQQMRHNFAQTIGFSVNIPIFDAFSTRNNVRRARLSAESARLRLEDSENRLYKAINQAYTQAVGAEKKLESSQKAVESARASFEAIKVKYDNGRANATEFERAKSTLSSALAQEVQSRYESTLRKQILLFYNRQN